MQGKASANRPKRSIVSGPQPAKHSLRHSTFQRPRHPPARTPSFRFMNLLVYCDLRTNPDQYTSLSDRKSQSQLMWNKLTNSIRGYSSKSTYSPNMLSLCLFLYLSFAVHLCMCMYYFMHLQPCGTCLRCNLKLNIAALGFSLIYCVPHPFVSLDKRLGLPNE